MKVLLGGGRLQGLLRMDLAWIKGDGFEAWRVVSVSSLRESGAKKRPFVFDVE